MEGNGQLVHGRIHVVFQTVLDCFDNIMQDVDDFQLPEN